MIYEPFLEKTVGIAVGTFQNFGDGHNLKNILLETVQTCFTA